MNNIESRLKRLEETIGVKTLTENSKQILNIGGYDEDNLFDYIIYPLYKFWNIEDPGFDTTEFLDLTDLAQAKAPAGYDPEDTFFIDVQKFAKLVTKEFVKRGLIGREFLNKSLPRFEVPEIEKRKGESQNLLKRTLKEVRGLDIMNKFLKFGFKDNGDSDYFFVQKEFGEELEKSEFKKQFYPNDHNFKYCYRISMIQEGRNLEFQSSFEEQTKEGYPRTPIKRKDITISSVIKMEQIEKVLKEAYDEFLKFYRIYK